VVSGVCHINSPDKTSENPHPKPQYAKITQVYSCFILVEKGKKDKNLK